MAGERPAAARRTGARGDEGWGRRLSGAIDLGRRAAARGLTRVGQRADPAAPDLQRCRHVLDRPAGLDRAWLAPRASHRVASLRVLVLGLDQQPVLLAALPPLHVHEMPAAFELARLQLELEMALRQPACGIALRRPAAAVPDDHAAGAVLALGDAPLELGIVERVVLDVHRQALVLGDRLGPLVTAQLFSTPSSSRRRS